MKINPSDAPTFRSSLFPTSLIIMIQNTDSECEVIEWKVQEGSYVKKDQIICKIQIKNNKKGESEVLTSKYAGLIKLKVKEKTSIDANVPLASFDMCTHDQMVIYGMCAVCGQRTKNSEESKNIVNTTGGVEIRLSETSAQKLQGEVEKRLHEEKKLAIAIDLDHTLINCELLQGDSIRLIEDLLLNGRVCPLPNVADHYIALRPKVRQFLKNLSNMYELYIYTHGRRHYAEAIRMMLDPKGTLFADRVISRTDVSEGDEIENRDSSRVKLFHKTFKRVLPCDDSMIVALDDKWDVWQYLPNVVRVRPYVFLSRAKDIRLKKQENSTAITTSEPVFDLDEHLDIAFYVLRDVHYQYYQILDSNDGKMKNKKKEDPNVGTILSNIRKQIFKDVVILFTGIFPHGDTKPHRRDIWIMAEALGAKCSHGELTNDVTHVVGVRATLKMRQGFGKPGVTCVHVAWIMESAYRWKRQIETQFRIANLTPQPLTTNLPALATSSSLMEDRTSKKRGLDSSVESCLIKRRRLETPARLETPITLDSEGGDTSSSSSEMDDDDIADIEKDFA